MRSRHVPSVLTAPSDILTANARLEVEFPSRFVHSRRSPARSHRACPRAHAGGGRRRHGQDFRPHPPHRAPGPRRPRAARRDSGPHLHGQCRHGNARARAQTARRQERERRHLPRLLPRAAQARAQGFRRSRRQRSLDLPAPPHPRACISSTTSAPPISASSSTTCWSLSAAVTTNWSRRRNTRSTSNAWSAAKSRSRAWSKSKNALDDAEVLGRCREIARVFTTMERWLQEENLGTFSHMITRAHALLHSDERFWPKPASRARFILADEFQDANFAQIKILARLAGADGNIFAVGDPDQAIYRFRGASSAAFELFHRHFPIAKLVVLEKNRRSTTPILRSAFALIDKNPPVFARHADGALAYQPRAAPVGPRRGSRRRRDASFPALRFRWWFSPARMPRAPIWSASSATRRRSRSASGPTSASSTALTTIATRSCRNWPKPEFRSSSRAWTSPTLPRSAICSPA